ncbi:hypothetical protein, partial [Streptococcus suis]
MNDNEVRKAPDALERVPEMLDTPPNRYHCISKTPQQTLGAFFVVDTNVGSNRPSSMSVSLLKNAMSTDILQNCRFCRQKHTKISSEEISDGRKYSLLFLYDKVEV